MSDKNRYITLLGDPIHTGPVKSVLVSSDFAVAGGATAATALLHSNAEDLPFVLSNVFMNNVLQLAIDRLVIEKIFLKPVAGRRDDLFIDSKSLKELCIDKTPSSQSSMKSIQKHQLAIGIAKLAYGILLTIKAGMTSARTVSAVGGALVSGQPVMPDHTHFLMSDAADLTRMYKGFKRFNKLAKGEWAIVTTPPRETVEEKQKLKDKGLVPA